MQDLIDAGIDGFASVIIRPKQHSADNPGITPLPSVLPLLGLEPANKEEDKEVSRLN